MEYSKLENKWLLINIRPAENYSSIQLAEDLQVRLLIAYDEKMNRCLILSLRSNEKFNFGSDLREHIQLEYFNNSGHLIITLKDKRFSEHFNALVFSAYTNLRPISSIKEAAKKLIEVYHKWSDFFSNISDATLSSEEVTGLFGELYYLKEKVKDVGGAMLNDLLKCWVGPFGKSHDFEFPEKDVEIKTKDELTCFVHIASEFQMESLHGKNLELYVISVNRNIENGITIGALAREVHDLFTSQFGDVSMLIKTLAKAGLPWYDIDKYNEYNFKIKSETCYNCLDAEFPKLTKSMISPHISNVRYTLHLDQLESFIISIKAH